MPDVREGYESFTPNFPVQARYLKKGEQVATPQGTYTSDGEDVHVIYFDGREDIVARTTFDITYGEGESDAEETPQKADDSGKSTGAKRTTTK